MRCDLPELDEADINNLKESNSEKIYDLVG